MRTQRKEWHAKMDKDIFGVDFHRFFELEGTANHMEIAEELGISLGEVRSLKKKAERT